MKILLDPGHGGGRLHNRGSVIGNEGDNNFLYACVLKKELEKDHSVQMTRNRISENPSLKRRGEMAKGFDLFLSIHSNAATPSVRGTEIYGDVNANHPALMAALVEGISKTLHIPNRKVRYRTRKDGKIHIGKKSPGGSNWYGVLYHNRADVGMLIEHVFHTNPDDCRLYVEQREKIAKCTASILRAFSIEYCVRVRIPVLNVRTGPGIRFPIVRTVRKNEIYHIMEIRENWGRLKSGVGWINISSRYCEKIR